MTTPDSYQVPDCYRQWIDQQTIDFIDRTVAFYPVDTISASITRQREIYDALCREFGTKLPKQVAWHDKVVDVADGSDVNVRCYSCAGQNPLDPTIIYMHGGGFVVGGLESHHDVCAEFCLQTGFDLVSVDYRLSPEHSHPAALNDVLAVVGMVSRCGKPIILCGDSAGGNLVAAATAACRDEVSLAGAIAAQVLIYPGLGGDCLPQVTDEITAFQSGAVPESVSSYTNHAYAPMLTLEEVLFYREVHLPAGGLDKLPVRQATIAPLLAEHFKGLPPTVCFAAQCDPLHDDGQWYCDAIIGAGGKASFISEAGMVHGYLRARNSVERASASFKRMVEALKNSVTG